MSTPTEVQALLRFLSQDAKVPLSTAMGKMKELQEAFLTSPDIIAKSGLERIKSIFPDEKLAKQVLNGAKRVSKKRTLCDVHAESQVKRAKTVSGADLMSPIAIEASLSLPAIVTTKEEDLGHVVLITNRAPLLLAFAVELLKYTMPDQPLSSRLSLAQAVVSANSRSKAVSLGIEKGRSAVEDGWGAGQPTIRVMGREVSVLKRWGYDPNDVGEKDGIEKGRSNGTFFKDITPERSSNFSRDKSPSLEPTAEDIGVCSEPGPLPSPALWGLDLDALRKSNGPISFGSLSTNTPGLPIYAPKSARAYLAKSFETASPMTEKESTTVPKKQSTQTKAAEKEINLASLLRAIDLLYESWHPTLAPEELDKRAWSWYVHVRPEVQSGVAGWGGKNEVRLGDILDLRKPAR